MAQLAFVAKGTTARMWSTPTGVDNLAVRHQNLRRAFVGECVCVWVGGYEPLTTRLEDRPRRSAVEYTPSYNGQADQPVLSDVTTGSWLSVGGDFHPCQSPVIPSALRAAI